MSKLILNMSLSVDGFISSENGDGSFALDNLKADPLFDRFYDSIDSVVMGRLTYDYLKQADSRILKQKHIFVITHYLRQQEENIVFIHENIIDTLNTLKQTSTHDIWLMGGAQVANVLLKEKVIDEMILTTAPILMGNGIRLFQDDNALQNLTLEESRTFGGCVQNRYSIG